MMANDLNLPWMLIGPELVTVVNVVAVLDS